MNPGDEFDAIVAQAKRIVRFNGSVKDVEELARDGKLTHSGEAVALGVIAHAQAPYPHEGGCSVCREVKRCNHCGRKFAHVHVGGNPRPACNNGRCEPCHATKCTPGGNDSPGHGFGL